MYYTVKEVAKQLKLSERTIRNKVGSGEIQKTKVADNSIRIKRSDLDSYLRSKNKK